MKLNSSWQIRLAQIILGAALVIALVMTRGTSAQNGPVHSTSDWSHRHLVFSTPKTLVGRFQASTNPSYVQQWVRRNAERKVDTEAARWRRAKPSPLHGDWSMNMGTGAKLGAGVYPAKYSFDVANANCASATAPDFVAYNTSLTGNSTLVAATDSGTFTAPSTLGATITITKGASVLTMTAAALSGTGTYAVNAVLATQALNLRNAINLATNGPTVGITATGNVGPTVNFAATAAGVAGNTIAVTSTANSFFGWTTPKFTGGASGQASIMAFDNLYSGCTGIVPTPFWAYNTGGTIVTSATLASDGQQVAFVQNVGVVASLVLLKWKPSATDDYNNPSVPTAVTAANYRTCVVPCMVSIPFGVTGQLRTDTNSSPYYDFKGDTIYVGDNGGYVHQFTNVFQGTPAETLVLGQWPAQLTNGKITTSPIFDRAAGKLFIADGGPGLNGGFLYSLTTVGPPVKITSAQVGFSTGIVDSPIVDSIAGQVYVFVANNSAGGTVNTNNSSVIQFPVGFAAAATGTSVNVGDSSGVLRAFSGDFDNAYYSSAAGNAGNLYVCGFQNGASNQIPTLWQIPITALGAMGAPVEGPALATAIGTSCGPVTEVFNTSTATDWIFTSVTGNAITVGPISCPSNLLGCIMSFNVTSGNPISAATTTTGHTSVKNGASGIVIDNTSAAPGASQVYFTPLGDQGCTTSGGTGGCAIQASQSNLF